MEGQELNRHQRRRMRTKKKLIDATIDLLLEKGYDAISIQDITDRADLGRGTFYIHFKTKEDIVWSIIKENLDEADRKARQVFGISPPSNLVLFAYRNMFNHAAENKDLYRIMLGSLGSSSLTKRVVDYLTADLERDMILYPLAQSYDIPLHIQARIITGAIIELIVWWLENDNEYNPDEMAVMFFNAMHAKR